MNKHDPIPYRVPSSYECPTCHSHYVTYHVMWANSYGRKVRTFCHVCGAANDITEYHLSPHRNTHVWRFQCTAFIDTNRDGTQKEGAS